MDNRGLAIISIVSGLIAVVVFIMIISAYAGAGGGGASAPIARASPGQPVDSDFIETNDGNQQASPGPTVQPVSPAGGQPQAAMTAQPVEAPSAAAPPNPFTAGVH
jgi:hypothetical protein